MYGSSYKLRLRHFVKRKYRSMACICKYFMCPSKCNFVYPLDDVASIMLHFLLRSALLIEILGNSQFGS